MYMYIYIYIYIYRYTCIYNNLYFLDCLTFLNCPFVPAGLHFLGFWLFILPVPFSFQRVSFMLIAVSMFDSLFIAFLLI